MMLGTRMMAACTLVVAVLSIGGAPEPGSLPTRTFDEGGPPKVGARAIATEVGTLGDACRVSLTVKDLPDADVDQLARLATDLDAITIWLIWDEMVDRPTAADLLKARVELRGAGSRGKGIPRLTPRAVLPIAGENERACAFLLDVDIGMDGSRAIDLRDGVKATGLTASAAFKAFVRSPGVYPLAQSPAATKPT